MLALSSGRRHASPRWGQARTGSSFIAAGSAGAGSRLVPAGDIVSCRHRWFHASSAVTARRPVLNPRGVAVRGFWMLLALVVAFTAAAGRDAPADYSRAHEQPVDQAYTDLIAKFTTDTAPNSQTSDYLPRSEEHQSGLHTLKS